MEKELARMTHSLAQLEAEKKKLELEVKELRLKNILVKHFISDVELCYFETFSASATKFNMVLLYKEPTRQPEIIDTDGMTGIKSEEIKEQMRACNSNIKFAEGLPLNWSQIMEEVRGDPQQFSEAGGWDCLATAATRNTELIIKMEPVQSLSCCCCEEKVRITGAYYIPYLSPTAKSRKLILPY